VVRPNWIYFFKFNQHRRGGLDIWSFFDEANLHFSTHQINTFGAALLIGWMAIVLGAAYRAGARRAARGRRTLRLRAGRGCVRL